MTMYCTICKKPTEVVKRDFGIGAYEFWGATGVDSCFMSVSKCCDGDCVENLEEYEAWKTEQEST
jgi:hypothetical protein